MERVIILNHSIKKIGLFTRTSTQGEEMEMVKNFIDYYIYTFLRYNKKDNLAIFIEPKVVSGFPDIVFASYSPQILNNWTDERKNLTIDDLKVLSHLIIKKGSSGGDLIRALRMQERNVLQSIEILYDANLICRREKLWVPAEMDYIYSINKLVAVEAKMSDIKKVTEQSMLNTWFSSHSYALINSSEPHQSTIQSFEQKGIGLYCKKKGFKKVVEAKKLRLPSSYQSLQFNEWIGQVVACT